MDQKIISEIIEDGVSAISGDNSQPWRFEVEENKVFLFNRPELDNPILNVRQRGSFIAHGSLIENIIISAGKHGYNVSLRIFPENRGKDSVAELQFSPCTSRNEILYPYIKKRQTNRKPYSKNILDKEEKDELLLAADSIAPGKLKFIKNDLDKKELGRILSLTEEIALTTKELHRLFFGSILWTEKEEKEKTRGLFIKTMELPPPIRALFPLLRHWPFMNTLNMLGFYKLAAFGNAKTYASSGEFGVVLAGDNDEDFVTAGRTLQRVWLTATKLGLSMQPVTGVLFLHQHVLEGLTEPFSQEQRKKIEIAYNRIETLFGVEGGLIAMLFRIGKAPEPSAKTSRLIPEINFKHGI